MTAIAALLIWMPMGGGQPGTHRSAARLLSKIPILGPAVVNLEMRSKMMDLWRAPIEFYGKVMDENSNAVAGATIKFHWVEIPSPDGNRTKTVDSDAGGLFSLKGAHGPDLAVQTSKEGYYTSRESGSQGFKYGSFGGFTPDKHNPVVFMLHKKGKGTKLMALKVDPRIERDGTPLAINLATGKTTSEDSADLVVRCWTDEQGKRSKAKYDWHCLIRPSGGLAITKEEFAFLAPDEGYVPSTEIAMRADAPDWTSDVDLKFYYRLADGRYGLMKFSIIAGGEYFCVIDSLLNPTGSPNLEPAN